MKKLWLPVWAAVIAAGLILPQAGQTASIKTDEQKAWIKSFSGKVEVFVSSEKNWVPAEKGLILKAGDKVRTQNGRAELVMDDGSQLTLSNQSTLELQSLKRNAENGIRSTLLKLWSGAVKAVVSKLGKASTFEVYTSNAVAAVKGTEFFTENDGNNTKVSCKEGFVVVSDLNREKEVLIKEHEVVEAIGDVVGDKKTLGPDELEKLEKNSNLTELKDIKVEDKSNDNSSESADNKAVQDQKDFVELAREITDTKDREVITEKQDQAERLADAQLGKVLTDMNGYRVRVDEYIFRPQLDKVEFLNLTQRTDGPNAGITAIDSWELFNQGLPDNYMDVKNYVDHNKILIIPGVTAFWAIESDLRQTGPRGDYIDSHLWFATPQMYTSNLMYNVGSIISPVWQPYDSRQVIEQNVTRHELVINDVVKFNRKETWAGQSFLYYDSISGQYFTNQSLSPSVLAPNTDPAVSTSFFYSDAALTQTISAPTMSSQHNALGGITNTINFSDGTQFSQSMYVIDNDGKVLDFIKALFLGAVSPRLIQDLNLELVSEATEFQGRTLDSVIVPMQ